MFIVFSPALSLGTGEEACLRELPPMLDTVIGQAGFDHKDYAPQCQVYRSNRLACAKSRANLGFPPESAATLRTQCQRDKAGQAPPGIRGGHERDGADDPIRELRS
jgi:hypothetical protein